MADPAIQGPYSTALGGVDNGTTPPPMSPDPQQAAYEQQVVARKDEIRRVFAPLIRSLRDRRRATIDTQWLLGLDCYKAQHRHPGFHGEWFNHYLPMARVKLDRFVKKVKKQLCPSPDCIEVYPANEGDPSLGQQAEAIKNYLTWRLWRSRFRSLIKQMALSLVLFQRAIIKTYLDQRDVPGQIWPSLMVVDPFSFYVWPETATNIDQCQVLVEHTMMPYETYDLHVQNGGCDPIDVKALTKPEWPQYLIERLSRAGLTPPSDVFTGANADTDREPIALVAMTELWVRRGDAWEQSWLVWNLPGAPVVVRLMAQPVAPYRMAVDRQIPGEHYMPSMMSDQEPLNVLFNDQVNMGLESQAISAFAPVVIDSTAVTRADSLVFGPRRKWLMDNVEGVKALEFPNTSGVSLQGAQMTMGLMDAFTGASPLAEGTPTRGMPRAGFAVSSLISLAMTDVTDMAELIEDEILTPALSDLYRLTVGVPGIPGVPYWQMVSLPGSEGVTAWRGSVGQLLAAASFRWVGTLQAQDMQVRAQRMLTFGNILPKIGPLMQQQGVGINWPLFGRRLWRDSMGERGADSIFIQLPPPMPGTVPPGGPPSPGTGGAPAPAPASNEQAQAQMSRGMAESQNGQMMAGTGMG